MTSPPIDTVEPVAKAFSLLWAIALIFHFNVNVPVDSFESACLVAAACALFITAGAPAAWIAVAVADIAEWWTRSPGANASEYFTASMHLTVLMVWGSCAFQHKRLRVERAVFFARLLPVLQVFVVFLFFWSAFHKLNTDFMEPTTSWSGIFYRVVSARVGLPPSSFLVSTAAEATLIVEFLPVFALLVPATRALGIVVLWGLFFMIALYGIIQFSARAYALTVLFLHPEFVRSVLARLRVFGPTSTRASPHAVYLVLWCVFVGLALRGVDQTLRVYLWLLQTIPALATVAIVRWRDKLPLGSVETRRPFFWMWPVLCLMSINELTPYAGLKDWPVFRMYSNLRTDSCGGNHVLLSTQHRVLGSTIVTTEETWNLLEKALAPRRHWIRDWIFLEVPNHGRSRWEESSFAEALEMLSRRYAVPLSSIELVYERDGAPVVEPADAFVRRVPRSVLFRFIVKRPEPDMPCNQRPPPL
jgi:hypothetical protein